MTKNFNDILDGSVKFGDSQRDCFEKGFEAGQQSKQDEVDELQKRIDVLSKKLNEMAHIFLDDLDDILKGDLHES